MSAFGSRASIVLLLASTFLIGLAAESAQEQKQENSVKRAVRKKTALLPDGWKTDLAEADRYLKSKEFSRAESCYRQALKELKLTAPDNSGQTAYCTKQLADVLYAQDMYDDAIVYYRKALRLARRGGSSAADDELSILRTMAAVFEDEGEFRKAKQFYEQAQKLSEKENGAKGILAADLVYKTARIELKLGYPAKAEEKYMAALALLMACDNLPDSTLLLTLLADYTDLLLNNSAGAKLLSSSIQTELLKDNLAELQKKANPPASYFSANVSSRIGDSSLSAAQNNAVGDACRNKSGVSTGLSLSQKPSDFAALEDINRQKVAFYERLIASDIDSLGADHPSVARDLTGLASLYISRKNFEQAKPLLLRALDVYQKVYKEDSGPLKQTKLLLQLISEEANPQSPTLDLSYLNTLPKVPDQSQKIEVALRLNDLAFMLFCRGKLDQSLRVYYWALASTALSTGETSLLSAANMVDMGKVLRLTGHSGEAEKLENNARAIARKDLLEKRSKLLP